MLPPLPKLDLGDLTARQRLALGLSVAGVLGLAALLLTVSLRRPSVAEYPPSPVETVPAGDTLVGPRTYTVDASDPGRWRFFDFSRGTVVESPGPEEWDLAFRRFHVIANGGEGFAGRGGLMALDAPFDSIRTVPAEGYVRSTAGGDSVNAAAEGWYAYSFTSHLLRPDPGIFAVRTADGRYARIRILSYYCPEARPGCLTFRYVYQGDGSRRVAPGVGRE